MSEKKKPFYKTLNNIVATNRVDNEEAYIINDYIGGLEMQLQQKENTIKEAREKLKKHKHDLDYEPWSEYKIKGSILFDLVEILDKANEKEDK